MALTLGEAVFWNGVHIDQRSGERQRRVHAIDVPDLVR